MSPEPVFLTFAVVFPRREDSVLAARTVIHVDALIVLILLLMAFEGIGDKLTAAPTAQEVHERVHPLRITHGQDFHSVASFVTVASSSSDGLFSSSW